MGVHGALDRGALPHPVPVDRRQQPLLLQRRAPSGARGARARRPVENKWIGQRIDEPDIDLASMAGAQGAFGIGPVTDLAELKPSLQRAVELVREGNVCVVDVRVVPGYDSNLSGSPARR